jgi:hypothetical protein
MKLFKHVLAPILGCAGAVGLGGCGPAWVDDLPRQAVSGQVTRDGAPLKEGTISFRPTTDLPTPAMVAIHQGSYSIPSAQGLVPGVYEVAIVGSESPALAEKAIDDPPGPATRKQTEATDGMQRAKKFGSPTGKGATSSGSSIPARYNTATTLTAEVKKGASNSFDFALTSAATPAK